jgi:hypothetical protein
LNESDAIEPAGSEASPPTFDPPVSTEAAVEVPQDPGPPALVLRPYDLPGARKVVITGLQLAATASRDLRRASLYVGLLSLGLLGPTVVYALAIAAHYNLANVNLNDLFRRASPVESSLQTLVVMAYAAGIAWVAVAVDGQLIALSLVAARAGERAFTLRDATARARQVFWRMIRGSVLVGILNLVIQELVRFGLGDPSGSQQGPTIIAAVISVIALAPFGYLATGIVLGDVGAVEALKRSVRLTRARPSIALVVALFTLLTAAIQVFALSAGLGVLVDVADFFHLDINAGGVALVATVVGLLAFVMALGSLIVTIAAIVTAPQVAAFLGLTFYSGGLDRVRDVDPSGRTFRWVTRPMAALMVILGVAAVVGIANLS